MDDRIAWLLVENTAGADGAYADFPSLVDRVQPRLRHLGPPAVTTVEAVARCRIEDLDVMLVDLKLPDRMGGIGTRDLGVGCIEQIALLAPHIKVAVFSNDEPDPSSPRDRDRVRRLSEAGVRAYILKDVGASATARALVDVANGEPVFKPGPVWSAWNKCLAAPHPCVSAAVDMSPTQHRAMVLAATIGLSTDEIAKELKTSSDMVQVHLAEAGHKAGAWPRYKLLIWARAHCPDCQTDVGIPS